MHYFKIIYVYGISTMLWLEPSVFCLVAAASYYLVLFLSFMLKSLCLQDPPYHSAACYPHEQRGEEVHHMAGEKVTHEVQGTGCRHSEDGLSSGRWSSFVRISVAAMQCCFLWGHFQPMSSSVGASYSSLTLNFFVHPAKKSLFYSYCASTTEKWIGRRSSEIVVKEQL